MALVALTVAATLWWIFFFFLITQCLFTIFEPAQVFPSFEVATLTKSQESTILLLPLLWLSFTRCHIFYYQRGNSCPYTCYLLDSWELEWFNFALWSSWMKTRYNIRKKEGTREVSYKNLTTVVRSLWSWS